jgi:hypothetical protein
MDTITQQLEKTLENGLIRHFSSELFPASLEGLFDKIMARISLEAELSKLKTRLWAALVFSAATLAVLVFAVDTSLKAFAQAPSFKFLSLIFTDFKLVADNWQDYAFSVLENLPLGAMAFLLSSALASILLLDFAGHQFKNFRKLLHRQHRTN